MERDNQQQEECEWNEEIRRPSKVPPSIIYHYCSVDAFIKIVTNKTLWLTNLFFMNDSQEHNWLRAKAHAFVGRQVQRHPDDEGYQYLETILRKKWQREIYCVSFSEEPDLLSQWRAYADDGKGFAIGFSTEHLQRLCTHLRGNLSDVIYNDEKQATLIEKAFDLPPRLCDGEDPTIEEGYLTILTHISEAASRCKNKAFSEEKEWRFVCEPMSVFGPDDETFWTKATVPRYADRRGMITPYLEIPLVEGEGYRKRGMEPIKEVYFGPKNTAAEQEYALTGLLANAGFKRVQLFHSSASYR